LTNNNEISAVKSPVMVIDPFKLAEWNGWGYGLFKQAIFRLPAGTTVTLTLDVPDDEVWWVTYTILGDVDDSSILMSFTLYKEAGEAAGRTYEEHKNICAHEGWVGEPFCFHPNTDVITEEGVKKIKDIRAGDKVLTEKGFKKVIRTFQRFTDKPLVKITSYYSNIPILATPEHPFLVLRREKWRSGDEKITWVNASSLRYGRRGGGGKGDYLLYPRIRNRTVMKNELDIAPLLGEIAGTDGFTLKGEILNLLSKKPMTFTELKSAVSYSTEPLKRALKELLDFAYIDKNGRYGNYVLIGSPERLLVKHDGEMFLADEDYVYNVDALRRTRDPLTRKVGPDAMRFFGYYVSEGYCSHGEISLCNRDENVLKDMVKTVETFGIDPYVGGGKVQARNKTLQHLLTRNFGVKADEKKLPLWLLYAPEEYQYEFLKGYYTGDGHSNLRVKDKRLEMKTVSPSLANDLRLMLHGLGYPTSIYYNKDEGSYSLRVYSKYAVSLAQKLGVKMLYKPKQDNKWAKVMEDFVAIKVKEKDIVPYSGLVYNLEVEETHTYNAQGFIVHNCPPGWHLAMGKGSIVCTVENVTGDTDYNDLSEKEEFVHLTLLIFTIKKDKVKLIDRLLNKMLSKMGV